MESGSGRGSVAESEHAGGKRVVQVAGVVGYLVRHIDQLRFQRRTQAWQIFIQNRILAFFEIARMFRDAFPDLKSQIQSWKARIAMLERFDDTQCMQIVIEAVAEAPHLAIQFFFAGVGEGRMAHVMAQRQGFGKILIQFERRRYRSRHLRNLDGVGQAVAKMVGNARWKNLRLIFQSAEGVGVNDAIAIALKFVAVRMRQLRIPAAETAGDRKAQAAKSGHFCGRSESAVRAALLTLGRGLPRSGSRLLRARAGSEFAISSASEMVASSLGTMTVG